MEGETSERESSLEVLLVLPFHSFTLHSAHAAETRDTTKALPKVILLHEVAVEQSVLGVRCGVQQLTEKRRRRNEVELRLRFLSPSLWRADEVTLRDGVLVVRV